jgi:chromosome segregation ATPase
MQDASPIELSSLAVLGTLGSVCAVLLRSTNKNLDSLEQMRHEASAVIEQLRGELRDNDEAISKLQALRADYRYHIGALRAERRQLKLEIGRLRAAQPIQNPNQIQKEGQ